MLPIESVEDFSLNKKINFKTLDGHQFTLKPQIYEEKNEFCPQKDTTLGNKTKTVSSSTYLAKNKKISIQNTFFDEEDISWLERYKTSVNFTPYKRMALVFGHLYQLGLFSDEVL
ncbi:hypothetical protein HZS_5771 [Henneguya salminicola]|nr:hypothetical protein HZS_5771 [Henneguya salminicola]